MSEARGLRPWFSVKELYRLAMQQGLSEKDFSAIHSFLKEGSKI